MDAGRRRHLAWRWRRQTEGGRAGFQLWIALSPSLELGPSQSVYQVPQSDQRSRRASFSDASNSQPRITPPDSINYLAVRMKQGERWRYQPPDKHTVLWVAIGAGTLAVPEQLHPGELVGFEPSNTAVEFRAQSDCEFVLGSAVPHQHDLVLGYSGPHEL